MDLTERKKKLLDLVTELELLINDKDIYNKMYSSIDKEVANHLHFLEMEGLNSVQISKITKSLRGKLAERRRIKGLVSLAHCVANKSSVDGFLKLAKMNLRPENEIKECIKNDYFTLLKEVLDK